MTFLHTALLVGSNYIPISLPHHYRTDLFSQSSAQMGAVSEITVWRRVAVAPLEKTTDGEDADRGPPREKGVDRSSSAPPEHRLHMGVQCTLRWVLALLGVLVDSQHSKTCPIGFTHRV